MGGMGGGKSLPAVGGVHVPAYVRDDEQLWSQRQDTFEHLSFGTW